MIRYYQTDDMEAATRSLAERHHHVLVLMDYKSVKPIRMRTKALLGDLDIEWVMSWKPGADEVVERWKRKGGILQYRSNPLARRPLTPVADAVLFCEAPMQWDTFEHACMSARQEVVVYRPPSWKLHAETIEHLYPPRDSFETLEAYMDALAFADQSDYRKSAAKCSRAFKRPVAFTADDLKHIAGWSEKYLKFLLRRYKFTVHRWHPYKMRLKPDDPDMLWAWRLLSAQPSAAPREHMLRSNATQPRTLGLKPMLKALVKGKYIAPRDCIYVTDAERRPVDMDALDAVHNMHRGRWFKLRNFIDNLPEYEI